MVDKYQRIEYVDLSQVRGGVLDPYNITGYYTDQNKRTYCLLEPKPENLVRIEEMNITLFRTMVPMTTLKSGTRTMRYLIDSKILQGDYESFSKTVKPLVKNEFIDKCTSNGWQTINLSLISSKYTTWRSKIKNQLSKIAEDRGAFHQDSTVNETVVTLKNHFRYSCIKFGWSPNKMEQVCYRAMQEFIIEQVMNA